MDVVQDHGQISGLASRTPRRVRLFLSDVPRVRPLGNDLARDFDVSWGSFSSGFPRAALAGQYDAILLDFCWDPYGALHFARALSHPVTVRRPPLVALGDAKRAGQAIELARALVDCIISPDAPPIEVALRIRGFVLSGRADCGEMLSCGDILLDCIQLKAWRGQRQVRLSRIQFDVLRLLLRRGGQEVSRAELASALWPQGADVLSVTACVGRLRRALNANGEADPIQSSRKGGYFIAPK